MRLFDCYQNTPVGGAERSRQRFFIVVLSIGVVDISNRVPRLCPRLLMGSIAFTWGPVNIPGHFVRGRFGFLPHAVP